MSDLGFASQLESGAETADKVDGVLRIKHNQDTWSLESRSMIAVAVQNNRKLASDVIVPNNKRRRPFKLQRGKMTS